MCVAKTKALISCAVTVALFSHMQKAAYLRVKEIPLVVLPLFFTCLSMIHDNDCSKFCSVVGREAAHKLLL